MHVHLRPWLAACTVLALAAAGSAQAITPSLKVETGCETGTQLYDKPTGRNLIFSSVVDCVTQTRGVPAGILAGSASEYGATEWSFLNPREPRLEVLEPVPSRLNYAGFLARPTRGNFGAITVARTQREETTDIGNHGGRAGVAMESWDTIAVLSDTLAFGTPVNLRFTGHMEFAYNHYSTRDATLAYGPSRDDQQWLDFSASISVGVTNAFFRPLGGTTACASVMFPGAGCLDIDGGKPDDQFGYRAVSGSVKVPFDFTLESSVGHGFDIQQRMTSFSAAGFFTQNFEPLYAGSMLSEMIGWNSATLYVEALTEGATVHSLSGHDYAPLAVPEPQALALWLCGLVGVAAAARRHKP